MRRPRAKPRRFRVADKPRAGASPTRNDLGGYSFMQAESKEALAELMKDHPHFMMADGTIEIVDLVPMPGM